MSELLVVTVEIDDDARTVRVVTNEGYHLLREGREESYRTDNGSERHQARTNLTGLGVLVRWSCAKRIPGVVVTTTRNAREMIFTVPDGPASSFDALCGQLIPGKLTRGKSLKAMLERERGKNFRLIIPGKYASAAPVRSG